MGTKYYFGKRLKKEAKQMTELYSSWGHYGGYLLLCKNIISRSFMLWKKVRLYVR